MIIVKLVEYRVRPRVKVMPTVSVKCRVRARVMLRVRFVHNICIL